MVISEQKQEDGFSEVLEKIRPDPEEFINRRIYHKNFALAIFWLCEQSRKEDFVVAKDLSTFLRLSMQRSLTYLNDLTDRAELFKKVYANGGGMAQYWFNIEGNLPTVRKYFDRAIKMIEFLGFQREGVLEKYLPDKTDAYLYKRIIR